MLIDEQSFSLVEKFDATPDSRLQALCRSSQPLSGITQRVLQADNEVLMAIKGTASNPGVTTLHIYDARPKLNANANALAGKGYESVAHLGGSEVVSLTFLEIGNIHVMRSSMTALVAACSAKTNAFTAQLASSRWLEHLALILEGQQKVASSLEEGNPVLVHCSDGWDRTAQLTAGAQLLLDPHYRTMEGFATLVEKDWCGFGHMFQTRTAGYGKRYEEHSSSPIFLQWLDGVHQLVHQFPGEFEFGDDYLLELVYAVYSGWFGTFVYDSERERAEQNAHVDTISVWDYLAAHRKRLANPIFAPQYGAGAALPVDTSASAVLMWRELFQRWGSHSNGPTHQLRLLVRAQQRLIAGLPGPELLANAALRVRIDALKGEHGDVTPAADEADGMAGLLETERHALEHSLARLEAEASLQRELHRSTVREMRALESDAAAGRKGAGAADLTSKVSHHLDGSAVFSVTIGASAVFEDSSLAKYTAYLITVRRTTPDPAEWSVYRRFSDFVTLQKQLEKINKCFPVPLPAKTLVRHHSAAFVDQRIKQLDSWSKALPRIGMCKPLSTFLDPSEMSTKPKAWSFL